MTFLQLQDVSFGYPDSVPVVDGVSLDLAAGEFHCLVGRSGCGKTTLLKLAADLLHPTRGQVLLRGEAVRDRRDLGFVFQAPTLLDWLRVRDNVLLPVSLQRRPTAADTAAADALLAQLGLGAWVGRHPRQLSGGQQSRVALARALLLQPSLLLLDEPFAALDAITREEVQQDLLRVCRERGTTVLFVTHDIAEAVFLGDRVSVMAAGRLVRTLAVDAAASVRDTPAFGAACATLREALTAEEAWA
ncbi:MAG TPA: ABC transporter ATP-binding protein [Ramlibacter sp.]|jgi:NitT/TauT family transport system ATP-binding protein|uniref:ABC transporter ATP-binding protein n=1 Tax=Ramlibacter sp. TaxID=1917967 RepID=UPI002D6EEF96|nr:ABC transporter ATP-binding protein [Ramlibacter sp.]HZY18327.1 ABC transporter ATP-binding protein [Ramlibacter sp.]